MDALARKVEEAFPFTHNHLRFSNGWRDWLHGLVAGSAVYVVTVARYGFWPILEATLFKKPINIDRPTWVSYFTYRRCLYQFGIAWPTYALLSSQFPKLDSETVGILTSFISLIPMYRDNLYDSFDTFRFVSKEVGFLPTLRNAANMLPMPYFYHATYLALYFAFFDLNTLLLDYQSVRHALRTGEIVPPSFGLLFLVSLPASYLSSCIVFGLIPAIVTSGGFKTRLDVLRHCARSAISPSVRISLAHSIFLHLHLRNQVEYHLS
jgi:hypothetical protein